MNLDGHATKNLLGVEAKSDRNLVGVFGLDEA